MAYDVRAAVAVKAEAAAGGPNTLHRGFPVTCYHCGNESSIRIQAEDVRLLYCTECDSEFSAEDARLVAETWLSLLDWLDSAPPYPVRP
jgi:transcription elongation factor Elf1